MEQQIAAFEVKKSLAQKLKGGVIMDVVTPDQAKIAEDAGAVAVMALGAFPQTFAPTAELPIWRPRVNYPDHGWFLSVMAKCRIGHFVEAQILESLGVTLSMDLRC